MSLSRHRGPLLVIVLSALTFGCGGSNEYYAPEPDPYYQRVIEPGQVEPANESEAQLLEQLSEVPVDTPTAIGSCTAVAGASYVAGSGRICRRLAIQCPDAGAASAMRVACTDQTAWFFVPDVFASGGSNELP